MYRIRLFGRNETSTLWCHYCGKEIPPGTPHWRVEDLSEVGDELIPDEWYTCTAACAVAVKAHVAAPR